MDKRFKALLATLVIVLFFGWFTFSKTNFFPFIFQLLFTKDINLKQVDGKINILLLGSGGGTHEGPDLTDTVIFVSINPTKDKVILVSVPRDLWVPELSKSCNACGKINTAYSTGGLPLAEKAISTVLNQPISYGIRVNFDGFVKAVDLVGGINVNIDNSFDDYQYPIDGKENASCGHTDLEIASLSAKIASGSTSEVDAFPCRYMHVHFNKGLTHLDGKNALEFVRSRHAEGDEGTDFARSARQEKVIKAFKDKIFSAETILNPVKVLNLYTLLKGNIDTDIKPTEMDDFVRLFQNMRTAKISSAVLGSGDQQKNRPGLLTNPPTDLKYDYQWVLVPRIGNGNFQEIQGYVDCELTLGGCSISPIQ